MVAFETEADLEKTVRAFMGTAIDQVTANECGARGCLLASCVATSVGEVDGVDQILLQSIHDTDQRLAARFDVEQENGVLPKNFPSLERA